MKGIKFISKILLLKIKNKYFIRKNHLAPQIHTTLQQNHDILTLTWINKNSFKNNIFTDSYLNKLYDLLKKKNKEYLTLRYTDISFYLIKKSYQSKKIIPLIYFFHIKDLFSMIRFLLSTSIICSKNTSLYKQNKHLVDNEVSLDIYRSLSPYLHYLCIRRFFKKFEFNNKSFLYLLENQPYEKMCILARNYCSSKIKLIAYQHTMIPPYN